MVGGIEVGCFAVVFLDVSGGLAERTGVVYRCLSSSRDCIRDCFWALADIA